MVPVPADSILRAADLVAFHDARLVCAASPPPFPGPLWGAIEANHEHNARLWSEEDLARRKDVPDAAIVANKRAIDAHNQKRNDAVERIDEILLESFSAVERKSSARLSSETAGAMTDRLSILALKIRAMRVQTARRDVHRQHIDACGAKLATLLEQRSDLAMLLDRLLVECREGHVYFKIYRQYKMYNDPTLNPALYAAAPEPKA